MNQQEVNFDILAQNGIIQISESPILTEYIIFGNSYTDTYCSVSIDKIQEQVVI